MRNTRIALFILIIVSNGCDDKKKDSQLSISWVQSHASYTVPLFDIATSNRFTDIKTTNSILIKNNNNDSLAFQFCRNGRSFISNMTNKFYLNTINIDTVLAPNDSIYLFFTTTIARNFEWSSSSAKDSLIMFINETINSSNMHLIYQQGEVNSIKKEIDRKVEKSQDFFIPITEQTDSSYIPNGFLGD